MNIKFNKLVAAVALSLISIGAIAVPTDSGTGTMGVTATVAEECSIGGAVALAFGNLSMLANGAVSASASASTGGGTFDAICTNGTTSPKLKFTSANTGTSNFRLKGVTDPLVFIVYTLAESGGTAIAYDTAAAFTGFAADGTTKNLTIKGSIAASEKTGKKIQAYSDTITITSTYGI